MEQSKKSDYQIKLLLLGDQAVGKSSLMIRYTEDIFNLSIMGTAGVDLKRKNIIIDNENVKVMIYDTAGHERFRSIAKTQYKGSKGIILVYDVAEKKSFDRVSTWMDNIKEHLDTDVEILLVGNKIDMKDERIVSSEEGENLAKNFGVSFMETSAKTGENVDTAFMKLIKKIYDKEKLIEKKQVTETLNSNDKKEKKKSSKCC
jgi:small GTP-binding protein